MSYITEQDLKQGQDDWKRTQVRMPQPLYEAVNEYAKNKDFSLNTAMIDLMNKALINKPVEQQINISANKFLENQLLHIFDEQLEKARKDAKDKFPDITQDELDAFLAWRLEQK
ncbi:hypothetical protein SKB0120_04690 [Moraxella osloensis]|nr:hypothetical protein [Moraxella osloensis]MBL7666939.1 hypothetical protein [Moraxella osloensis]BAV11066.1 hypothetical protein MOSL_0493 [Moraxella osloensis]